jgi:hypothetical protein
VIDVEPMQDRRMSKKIQRGKEPPFAPHIVYSTQRFALNKEGKLPLCSGEPYSVSKNQTFGCARGIASRNLAGCEGWESVGSLMRWSLAHLKDKTCETFVKKSFGKRPVTVGGSGIS